MINNTNMNNNTSISNNTNNEHLNLYNLKKGLYVKTNRWTKNNRFVYFKIRKCMIDEYDKNYKFLCILPKESIKILMDNYVKEFEWEYYLKCLHRYGLNDKLNKDLHFLQKNSLIKNLKTKMKKRGQPKKRSRPILVDFFKEKNYLYIKKKNACCNLNYNINSIPHWLIVKENEYIKFTLTSIINKFIYFIYKNEFKLTNELYRNIYTFIY